MSDQGSDLLKKIATLLDEHGVYNWVVAFNDPDDTFDIIDVQGSKLWRAGVGMDLVDDVKAARRKEREKDE